MDDSILYVYLGLMVFASIAIITKPVWIYYYPGAVSAVFLAFVSPQLVVISLNPHLVPEGSFVALLIMSICSFIACWLGWQVPTPRGLGSFMHFRVDPNRLFLGGVVLLMIGTSAWAISLIFLTDVSVLQSAQHTGLITILIFFHRLVYPGFAICLITAIRYPNVITISCALLGSLTPIVAMFVYGRRSPTAHMITMIGICLYFEKRFKPPRLLVVAAIIGGVILLPLAHEYRQLVRTEGLIGITEFNPVTLYLKRFTSGNAYELIYAAVLIDAANHGDQYGMGGGYWNAVIFQIVPAQLVGPDTKAALCFTDTRARIVDDTYTANLPSGISTPGMTDCFLEFSYFGCMNFFLLGVIYKMLWTSATKYNSTCAKIFYLHLILYAMLSATHGLYLFLPAVVYGIVFIGPVFLYARVRERSSAI